MKFLRNHWYDLGACVMIVAAVLTAVFWSDMSILRRLAAMNFVVILWHMFEEYRLPGGEAAITNLAMQPSDKGPADRYPLNQNNAMFINMVAAYIVYLVPMIWPNIMWLSFMPILFGMTQVIMHAFMTPKKMHTLYSPGELACVLGHLPIGIYWFYHTISTGRLDWLNVIGGLVYQVLFIGVIMMKVGYGLLADPNSKYPFPQAEFERSGYAERIRQLKK